MMRWNCVTVATGLTAVALAFTAGAAGAAVYDFQYHATDGHAPVFASGQLTVADTLDAAGGYDILGISGQVDGDAITGLTPNPNQPFDILQEPAENYDYDNVLYASAPALDFFGVLFHSATTDYNIFTDASPTDFVMLSSPSGVPLDIDDFHVTPYPGYSHGDFSLSAAPEPAAWALMVLGFLGAGAALRRRPLADARREAVSHA